MANSFAVGAAIATLTGCAFASVAHHDLRWVMIPTCTTLAIGSLWAVMLRSRRRVTRWKLRRGWVASMPLAALNAALACPALVLDSQSFSWSSAMMAAVLGATFGAIIWIARDVRSSRIERASLQ